MAGETADRRGQIEAAAPRLDANAFLIAAIVVAALYFGREVFLPITFAVLLSFVLAPLARVLQGVGLGRVAPVVIVVLFAFLVIGSIGGIVTTQLTQLAGDLPQYQTTIKDKITRLRGAANGRGPLERAAEMVQDLGSELTGAVKSKQPAPAAQPTGAPGLQAAPPKADAAGRPADTKPAEQKPVPVEIQNNESGPLQMAADWLSPLVHPLATMGLVAIFVVFILLQRGDLRNRFIRLAGSHDLQRTTAAMNDAAYRLSRYFLMQLLLNSLFGIVVGTGLWLIGVPSPVLWGIIGAVSRFVPYVGAVMAAGMPLVLAAAVDPNWTMLLETAALFAVTELLIGQIVEPLVYGHSTGLSPVAVIVSVTFWTWLWGPAGLLLATPLTVCVVVLGRHVERLGFLAVLLGDRPALTAPEVFYQRMLAGDPGEAVDQAERFLKRHRLSTYYDAIALRGLALAQADLGRGVLDPDRLGRIETTARQLIDDLSEHEDAVPEKPAKADESEGEEEGIVDLDLPVLDDAAREAARAAGPVLCIAARSPLDRIGAEMLAQILGKHGLSAEVEGPEALLAGAIALKPAEVRTACLLMLDVGSQAQVRYAVRRIRRRLPNAKVILSSWGVESDEVAALCEAAHSDHCASRLAETVRICLDGARSLVADAESGSAAAGLRQPALTAA